ncbi:MAG: LysM peptidoglycan-binding domain-containing protein [Anaerolineae bacterium]|nr:LysM peptidoglycan-binding domain-containing protein [Anaerolineae bacterium]
MKNIVRPTRLFTLLLVVGMLAAAALACTLSGDNDKTVYITATPLFDADGNVIVPPTHTPDQPTHTPIAPTPNPTRPIPQSSNMYVVQAGDTLGGIAALYGADVNEVMALNGMTDPNTLEVGMVLEMPGGDVVFSPNNKLIPDSELVMGPTASGFSIAGFVKFQQGFLKAYSEVIDNETWSGVEIIDFVASNYSVNPRLLLAILEYRSGWITEPYPSETAIQYPMGIFVEGREGLLKQMLDAAEALNYGYYGWKYRGTVSLTLSGGPRVFYAPDLNAGTIGVQYMLSLANTPDQWQRDLHPDGFFQTYLALFGDPFANAYDPLVPPDLTQPELTLPFAKGEEWVYTGGPHGGYNSGSAWAAVDFAPPEPPEALVAAQGSCYISPAWATAAAPGVIARSGEGYVILDLDGDGDEHTGWTLVYLHVDDYERIATGATVKAGDPLGHLSCEGGVSSGTHLHFARRYNGEWIPAQCHDCAPGISVPQMVLGEWTIFGYPNQEYQGYMSRPGEDNYRQAEQTRDYAYNKVEW